MRLWNLEILLYRSLSYFVSCLPVRRETTSMYCSVVDLADTVAVERHCRLWAFDMASHTKGVSPQWPSTAADFTGATQCGDKCRVIHGLQVAYCQDCGTHKFIWKLLGLPHLPCEDIITTFDKQISSTILIPNLITLVVYIRKQWITSTLSPC